MLFQWREAFVVLLGGRKKRENRSINLIVFLCYVVLNLLSSLFNYLFKQYYAIRQVLVHRGGGEVELVEKIDLSSTQNLCQNRYIYFLFVLLNLITNIQQSFYVMTKINDETMGHSIFLLFFPNAPNNWMQLYSIMLKSICYAKFFLYTATILKKIVRIH